MKLPVGRVYVLSNKSMPGLVKVGYTMNTVEARVRELSTATGVPSEFKIEYQVECRDPAGTEMLVHRSLDSLRYNKSREFFSADIELVVCEIRKHAKDILEEEFDESLSSRLVPSYKLEDFRRERDSLDDWIEVKNQYQKILISKSYSQLFDDSIICWQMHSLHQSKKMREFQSVVSKRRYFFNEGNFQTFYDCYYRLPMCEGEVVNEVKHANDRRFPIREGNASSSIILVVKRWK
jgi:hypothetical protein